MELMNHIRIKGARVNNLKGIDVDIPRDRFVVITGVSGSGKSSLAFETLFAEGQRRFAESISSFARQFLGRMSKPDVESITGIPPAIAIEQKVNTRNPRSTVGTTTEIYDYLRVIFAKIGRTYSPISGEEVVCDSMESVMQYLRDKSGTLYLMADLKWEEEKYRIEKLLNLKEEGFSRVYIAAERRPDESNAPQGGKAQLGEVVRIDALLSDMEKYAGREVMLMVDRISLSEGATEDEETAARLMDSIKSAFEKGEGTIHSVIVDETNITARRFSTLFEADGLRFEKPQEWMFNFNSPLGACPVCGGLGQIIGIDEALVIPNAALSVYQDAIACWRGNTMSYFKEQLILNAHKFDFPIHTPYNLLTAEQKRVLWEGNEHLFGINDFFKELEAKRYKIQNKYMISRYSGRTVCRECGGHRLKKEALYIKVGGKSIADLMDMNIGELSQYFRELTLTDYERSIVSKAINEVTLRLT
ncbi:MAG: excinuclease ABC subunit A, partial [Bacteroidales bacterium]|nr:excinuclease ABC subunit A [Bacteroidales bacterium]